MSDCPLAQENTRLEAHFRAELHRVEALVAAARKHARMATASTMQSPDTATIVATTSGDGITAPGSDGYNRATKMTVVAVATSDNNNKLNNNNNHNNSNSDESTLPLASNTHEQGLAHWRARENELRVAQLERQLQVAEQQTKALEQGLDRQGNCSTPC